MRISLPTMRLPEDHGNEWWARDANADLPTTSGWRAQCEAEGTRYRLSPDQGAEPTENMFISRLICFLTTAT